MHEKEFGWVITQNGVPYRQCTLWGTARVVCARLTWRDQGNVYMLRRQHPDDDLT